MNFTSDPNVGAQRARLLAELASALADARAAALNLGSDQREEAASLLARIDRASAELESLQLRRGTRTRNRTEARLFDPNWIEDLPWRRENGLPSD